MSNSKQKKTFMHTGNCKIQGQLHVSVENQIFNKKQGEIS